MSASNSWTSRFNFRHVLPQRFRNEETLPLYAPSSPSSRASSEYATVDSPRSDVCLLDVSTGDSWVSEKSLQFVDSRFPLHSLTKPKKSKLEEKYIPTVVDTLFLISFMSTTLFTNLTYFGPISFIPEYLQSRASWAFGGLLLSFVWAFYLLLTIPSSPNGGFWVILKHKKGKALLCAIAFLAVGVTLRSTVVNAFEADAAVEASLELEELTGMLNMLLAFLVWW